MTAVAAQGVFLGLRSVQHGRTVADAGVPRCARSGAARLLRVCETADAPSLARGDCRARVSVPRYWDR